MQTEAVKHCNRCGQDESPDGEFWYFKRGAAEAPCKMCRLKTVAEYRLANSEKIRERGRERSRILRATDPGRVRAYKEKYRTANRQKIRESEKKRRTENPDRIRKCRKRYVESNLDRVREISRKSGRKYWAANADTLRQKSKVRMQKSREENRQKFRQYYRQYHKIRIANPNFRLSSAVSRSIWKALSRRNSRKTLPRVLITGWSIDQLIEHLKPLFEEGMSFDNYGEWHIDHIVPLASIPFVNETDPGFRSAWALPNLAPLWAGDNLTKNARIDWVLPDTYRNLLLRAAYADADWSMAA